jgi:hypothetical protein
MLTEKQFMEMALSFPAVEQGSHFDVTDFRVRGTIFATYREKDGRAVLKLSPDQQRLFLETAKGMLEPVPGSWGGKGWTLAILQRIDADTLRHAMSLAWRSVAPKSLL